MESFGKYLFKNIVLMKKDVVRLCRKQVKKKYKKWPSARASQAVCKCRKKKGFPCKGKKLGQWERQKWINTKTGKPCGSGGPRPYCRPTKVVGYTPVLAKDAPKSKEREKGRRKPLYKI